ncbi:hypothetical protein Tco_0038070 [Tanacetum coccineum]
MYLYHSRLTPDDLNDLIIKYKIPRDLHPRLPSEYFAMSELPDDAIGIYHRMFDFSGVRIPFSSFLLALIKHYRLHFSQLGPLGLNKVITFEVLYRSLQIEPTVTLFRVFRLCANKSGFFFIDRRAILDVMVWRHPNAAIDDPRPADGSFNMADVRRLSAHVINLRDMLEGVLVLSGLSRVWKSRVCDSVLRGADGNGSCRWYPSFKIVAKAEASQKQKASTSGVASSHVVKCTRSALAQSFGSTTRPSLFVGDDDESYDDDDACVEIPLVTPHRSTAVIPSSENQGGSSVAPTAEDSNTQNSRGKGVMVDDVAAPSSGVSRQRPSFRPAPSFKDVSGDAVHTDFFPFSASPYYATYPEGGVAGNCEFTRQDELLACYRGLNQSHHEYVLSAESKLKGYEEKVANMTGLEFQVAALKKQVSGLNDKLTSSDASFAKSKAKGKERKKKIKSLGKSLDNLHAEMARLSAALNQATILEVERDEEILRLKATPPVFSSFFRGQFQGLVQKFLASEIILQLEPKKLESIVTLVSESLELYANVNFTASAVAFEHNEKMVNAEGISVALNDVTELVEVGSGSVPSGPDDVVVAISAHEKGDGLDSSSVASE